MDKIHMNIVSEIINKVNNELIEQKNDFGQAMLVAHFYLNLEMSEDDLIELILFSKKVDQRVSPNFKSIYGTEINDAVWSIVYWSVSINHLVNDLNRLFTIYTDLNLHLNIGFSQKNVWELKIDNYITGDVKFLEIISCSRTDFLIEITSKIIGYYSQKLIRKEKDNE